MQSLAPTLSTHKAACRRPAWRPALPPRSVAGTRQLRPIQPLERIAPRAAVSEVADALATADVARAFTTVNAREVYAFLTDHPVASCVSAVALLYIVPKLVEAFVRYLALPVAVALLSFYCLENPEDAAMAVATVLDGLNQHPEVATLAIIGLAFLGLVPALLYGTAATALVYCLLSISFGTQVPEVTAMQAKLGETVERVQVLSKVAASQAGQLQHFLFK